MSHSSLTADQKGEMLWKWTLRLAGLAAFGYILLAKDGNVPAAVYVIVGGLIGLPNVITLQNALNDRRSSSGDSG